MKKKVFLAAVSVLCAISLYNALMHWRGYVGQIRQTSAKAMSLAETETAGAALRVEKELGGLKPVVEALAGALGAGQVRLDGVSGRLREIVAENPGVYGAGVASIPHIHDPDYRRSSPYYVRGSSGRAGEALQLFAAPFYFVDPKTGKRLQKGEVFLDYSMPRLRDLVLSLDAGGSGYGFLLSEKGDFLVHPLEDYVANRRNIVDMAPAAGDDGFLDTIRKALRGERVFLDYKDEITGQSSWMFLEPVPSTHWVFARIFAKDEISSNTQELTRRKIWLSLWIISFLSFASMLALRIHREETFALWMYVIVQSFLLISGMAYNWYLDVKEPYFDAPGAMILDKAALGAFSLKYEKKSRRLKKPPPLFVPTGIEVQSMRFSGAGEVELSGLIWQKYRDRAHDGLSRGVLMPQASEFRLEEAYRRRTGEVETIGWAFKCVLDQRFDLRRYPGDSRMVSVRVLHRDFDSNVLLVPDLESYRIMNPNALPGLRDGFAMSGWNIRKSYFSFRDSTSNATMGIAGSVRETAFPDLYFNVFSTRSVIAPAISHLLPVGVAVCILFAVLLVITRHSEMLNRFGYTTLSTVGACSGLFFGVLLAHARFRGEVHADGFTYLETYHFTTYLATLLISVNSFLFNSSMQISFIQYRDNLYPKLLYWPVLLSVLLGITVWTYY